MLKLISLLFSFLIVTSVIAQDVRDRETIEELYHATLHYNSARADSILKKMSNGSAAASLAKANYYWWRIVSGDRVTENSKRYSECVDAALKQLPASKVSGLTHEELYSYIIAYAYKARLEGLSKNYIRGMVHINNCVNYIEASLGKEEKFPLFTLTSGLYHYYISTAGKTHPYLLPYLIFLPGGDEATGLKFLSSAAQNRDIALSTEANYFLMKIYLEKNELEKALKHCKSLLAVYPENLLYMYYHFKVILEWKGEEEARPSLIRLKHAEAAHTLSGGKQSSYFYSLAKDDLKSHSITKRSN